MSFIEEEDVELQLALLMSLQGGTPPTVGSANSNTQGTAAEEIAQADVDDGCYTILLKKDKGFNQTKKLGIMPDADGTGRLRILNWRNGSLIAAWNKDQTSPEQRVQANDSIETVDGIYIHGNSEKLSDILNDSPPRIPTIRITLRRHDERDDDGYDMAMRMRQVPEEGMLYYSLWYSFLGGTSAPLSNDWMDQTSYENAVGRTVEDLSTLTDDILKMKPSIVYIIFGGFLPDFTLTKERLVRRGACLDRRFPAPLLRLMTKEKDATVLIAILDRRYSNTEERKGPEQKCIPEDVARRLTVRRVNFCVPWWPCGPVLEKFREMARLTVNNHGGLFVLLDEMKAYKESCFNQVFALYPLLHLCYEFPHKALFMEWNPKGQNDHIGEICTYESRQARAEERFTVIRDWNGDYNSSKHANKISAFNYSRSEKNNAREGIEARKKDLYFDLSKPFYTS